MHMRMHMHIHTHIHIHMRIHVHIQTRMHTHVYIHIHTWENEISMHIRYICIYLYDVCFNLSQSYQQQSTGLLPVRPYSQATINGGQHVQWLASLPSPGTSFFVC